MIIEAHLRWLYVHLLLTIGQTHGQRHASIAQCQVQVVGAMTRVEEQSIWLTCTKVERDRVLGTDNGLRARLAQVVRKELCTAERCFRWRLLLLTILAIVLKITTLAYWTGIS